MVAIPVNVGSVAIQSTLQWSFVFLLLLNLRKTTGMNYLEDLELAFPEIQPFCQDSSTPFGVTPHHVNTVNAQIFHTHTSWQVYTISATMRYDHTTNQTHPSLVHHPKKYPQGESLDVGSSDGGSWRLIRLSQTFLTSPNGLTSTALGAPVFFPWRAFAFSASVTTRPEDGHALNQLNFFLLILLLGLGLMSASQFG